MLWISKLVIFLFFSITKQSTLRSIVTWFVILLLKNQEQNHVSQTIVHFVHFSAL